MDALTPAFDAALPPFIRAMLQPSFFAHRPAEVRLLQTHISYVLVARPLVYKVKKPVRFRFLDFSSLALRRRFCFEEVRLNQRLAPHVYRRVVGIARRGDTYELCDADRADVVEYAVEMSFLPEERRLDVLLSNGQVTPTQITRVAQVLADFHQRAATSPSIGAAGTPEALKELWHDNFLEAAPFRGRTLSAHDDEHMQRFVAAVLAKHRSDLEARVSGGRIRDGHGDLHADHVYLDDQVTIIDCIEFNERLRWCDVAADLAFLAMDLEFRGYPELCRTLIRGYLRTAPDPTLERLLPFYQCYRAYVRGKVESLKSVEPEVGEPERDRAAETARAYFELAYRYTWAYTRALLVLVGFSGTGKSTIAHRLHKRTGFALLRSDVLRKQLAGIAPDQNASSIPGVYSPEFSQRTYAALLQEAQSALHAGRGVILDATFLARKYRDATRALAHNLQVPLLFLLCECPPEVVRQRLEERQAGRKDASDADWRIYLSQREHGELFSPDEPGWVLRLDTSRTPLELVMRVEDELRARIPFPGNAWEKPAAV